jgi:hypothetical protein
MTSKAERKRRAKRKPATPFDLAPTPRREADGRPKRDKAADRQTLEARCLRLGLPLTPEGLRDARAPWYGCGAGQAMASVTPVHNDRLRLWDAITHMRRTVAAYDAAIGAPRRHAVCMNLLTPTEPMEADASSPAPDMRDDADRARQAVSAYMRLQGALDHDKASGSVAQAVVIDDAPCKSPALLISALSRVSNLVSGKQIS